MGKEFLISERLSFFGWGLGGHSLSKIILNYKKKFNFSIIELFPKHFVFERFFILCLPYLIFLKRLIVRMRRSPLFFEK